MSVEPTRVALKLSACKTAHLFYIEVWLYVRIIVVWECDRQNKTSSQKVLGQQSILLTKVCSSSPLSLCATREAAAEPG